MRVSHKDPREHTSPDGLIEGDGKIHIHPLLYDALYKTGINGKRCCEYGIELKSTANLEATHSEANPVYIIQNSRQIVIMKRSGNFLCVMHLPYDRSKTRNDPENGYGFHVNKDEEIFVRVFYIENTEEFVEWFEKQQSKLFKKVENCEFYCEDMKQQEIYLLDNEGKKKATIQHHPFPMVYSVCLYSLGCFKNSFNMDFPLIDSNMVYLTNEKGEYIDDKNNDDELLNWIFDGLRLPKDYHSMDKESEFYMKGNPPSTESISDVEKLKTPPNGIEIYEVGNYEKPVIFDIREYFGIIKIFDPEILNDDTLYKEGPIMYQDKNKFKDKFFGDEKPTWLVYKKYRINNPCAEDIHMSTNFLEFMKINDNRLFNSKYDYVIIYQFMNGSDKYPYMINIFSYSNFSKVHDFKNDFAEHFDKSMKHYFEKTKENHPLIESIIKCRRLRLNDMKSNLYKFSHVANIYHELDDYSILLITEFEKKISSYKCMKYEISDDE